MIIQTYANGFSMCKRCALQEFKAVSREYRPLVSQWVVYGEVIVPDALKIQCVKCSTTIN